MFGWDRAADRFTYAAAAFACGTADGPAVAIYLTPDPVTSLEPSGPYVRIYIDRAVEEVGGNVWPLDDRSPVGAWFHTSGGTAEMATSGYVIINSVSADKTVDGTVNLDFPNGRHVHGDFNAPWLSRTGYSCI